MKPTLTFLTTLLLAPRVLSAAEFHVSPSGNDANLGTDAAPFATLERARQAVREASKADARKVIVHGGTYAMARSFELAAEDSGSDGHPVVWEAAHDEEVRLSGGAVLPAKALVPITDGRILEQLDPVARGHVLQADLGALGDKTINRLPTRYRGAPPVSELFFNDQRMSIARWPNEGWATIARIVDSGSNPRMGDKSGRPGVFEYSGDRPSRWNVAAGVWLHGYWCFDWYDEVIRVKAIDREKREITFAEPHLYSVKQGNPSPRRYRALNVLEELDQPGEYYLDAAKGALYFWPPANPAGARIVLATLTSPALVLKDASNVVLRGFIIEACHGNGIEVRGGSGVRIEACRVRNIRQLALQVEGGTEHRVEACDIHDTGTGGLKMEGGDRRTLTPAGHEAVNNHIWRFSQLQVTSAYAIHLGGVGNRAAHNLVHDAPHQALNITGNDHVLEFNEVHRVCTETDDAGAFHKGRNPSARGNILRYNFWHHIGSPMGHGNAAVYFDDGDGGEMVFGNVFFRCGEPGKGAFGTVFSHGGHDNRAENNIFIECRRVLGSSPWRDSRWKETVEGGRGCNWQIRLLKEVDITKPPYTTRYPELIGFMNPKPGQPRVNHARNNLFVMCGEISNSSGNWQWKPEENWATGADPGFVDAAKGDFRLRPDAAVFKKLPGFKPIPFEKIGLFTDTLRPKRTVEPWAYPPPKPALAPEERADSPR